MLTDEVPPILPLPPETELARGIVESHCPYHCSLEVNGVFKLIQALVSRYFEPSVPWPISRVFENKVMPEFVIFWLGDTLAE